MAIVFHAKDSDRADGDETRMQHLRDRLITEDGFDRDAVERALAEALERYREARVREFVVVLAERDARRRLRATRSLDV